MDGMSTAGRIELCLVSHTNVGKTSLARTLLGRDIGEVRDAAHVTQAAEAHTLLTTPEGDELVLWDTPGLGDSARLYRRLSMARNPLGWFLSQVWDRWTDLPFYLSQQAMRTTREHADVVLYPVNATEDPADAGYLDAELKLLSWMDRPVIALLNQTGRLASGQQQDAEIRRWKNHLRGMGIVREVLPLDAFTRCWVHEQAFFETIGRYVGEEKRAAYQRLQRAWQQRNVERFMAAMDVIAAQILEAARQEQRFEPDGKGDWLTLLRLKGSTAAVRQQLGQKALEQMVEKGRIRTTRELLVLHDLQGRADHPFVKRLDAADFVSKAPMDPVRVGIGGAIASGAATGLAADAASGGLTLGTGALIGAISGALAFAAGAEGANRMKGVREQTLRLSDAALRALVQDALLKYVAIAHFGRGQGDYEKEDIPPGWVERSRELVDAEAASLDALFAQLRADEPEQRLRPELRRTSGRLALAFLAWMYPQADIRSLERDLEEEFPVPAPPGGTDRRAEAT